MIKIQLHSDTVANGNFYSAGAIVDWPDSDAKRLIKAGIATPATQQPECAMVAARTEKAVQERPKPRTPTQWSTKNVR